MEINAKKKVVSEMTFKGYGIEFHPVKVRDLRCLRQWRNSAEIRLHMLDTSIISPSQQILWYKTIKNRLNEAHWVAWYKGVRVGYANIKGSGDLRIQKTAEFGLYVGNSKLRHGLLGYAISLLKFDIAFESLSILNGYSWVHKDRKQVLKFDKQLGYTEQKCENEFIKINLSKADYLASKLKLKRYFN